ncbi:MAG: hypothetical protein WC996_02005 [Peptostreptococcales bacterium]|jgi:signal peptidase I
MKKRRYHIANKFRFTLFLVICFLFISVCTGLIFKTSIVSSASIENYEEIYVKKGDTLWSLVGEHFGEQTNKRKVLYDIEKMNRLNRYLMPGEVIKIPVYDSAKL